MFGGTESPNVLVIPTCFGPHFILLVQIHKSGNPKVIIILVK